MFLPDGQPREHARRLHDALRRLSAEELAGIQSRVSRTFYNESISFTVYGDAEAEERIIPVDAIPRVRLRRRLAGTGRRADPADTGPELLPRGRIRRGPHHRRRRHPRRYGARMSAITARKCAISRRPWAYGSLSAAQTSSAPTTASACWKTTFASLPACPI